LAPHAHTLNPIPAFLDVLRFELHCVALKVWGPHETAEFIAGALTSSGEVTH
jgi:hypothetical protein